MYVFPMTKNFQEINLTAANLVDSLVSDPGYIVISGNFDTGTVRISLTDDTSGTPINIPVQEPTTFTNPVVSPGIAVYINAHRLTFSFDGGAGAEDIIVKWYPVHLPF